jgi:hypothetical protein
VILSYHERNKIENFYAIGADVHLSLQYQLKKMKNLCEKVEIEIDKPRDTYYIASNEFEYNVDFLINGFSTLIEYYHTWVIQKSIGLANPNVKISYKAIKKDDDKSIDNVLKKYGVGKTEQPELYKFDFYEKCKSKYLSAMNFLFVGKCHEIFVLNNYIKHNHMMRGYAPLTILDGKGFSFPYLFIDNMRGNLLNRSLLRYLLNHPLAEVVDNIDDEYYKNYLSDNSSANYTMGGMEIIVVNGLEYVKSSNSIGLSIESILETISLASIDILNVMINELVSEGITGGTDTNTFLALKNSFKARKAKTINNLL